MKQRIVVAGLLSLSLTLWPANAETIHPLPLEDPVAAREFDYCHWRFEEGGSAEGLPDFVSILDTPEESQLSNLELRAHSLANAGSKIALASSDQDSCQRTFDKGLKAFTKAYAKQLKKRTSMAKMKYSEDGRIAAVQRKLTDLWARDQAARDVYVKSRQDDESGASFWTYRLAGEQTAAQDAASSAYMRTLLSTYDWIDSHRFDSKTASQAWLLVQHADKNPDLQALALERMSHYLDNGGVRKRDYAYLWDRVAVNHHRKQRYGTQPDWECKEDGTLDFRPMEDPANVDARRAEMGLGPAQEDLDRMAAFVCGQ